MHHFQEQLLHSFREHSNKKSYLWCKGGIIFLVAKEMMLLNNGLNNGLNNRLKEVRKDKKLTIQQVADAIGVGRNTISRYENGKHQPRPKTWVKLSNYYKIPVPYLMGFKGASKAYDSKNNKELNAKQYSFDIYTFSNKMRADATSSKNAFTKDYIYKCLDSAYKEDWKYTTADGIEDSGFKKLVDWYLKLNKINKPSKINMKFWKENFNFIFDNSTIKRLLTTKDEYKDDDIKFLLKNAIVIHALNLDKVINVYETYDLNENDDK